MAVTDRPPVARATLDPLLSDRLRFWSLISMVLLVYVHAFNLHPRYLHPMTLVEEPASPATVVQYLLANGLLRFRIPMLFAISGYLFALRDEAGVSHWTRVSRRLRTLGVPYVAWSAIALAITWALEQWAVTRGWVVSASLSPFGPEKALLRDHTVGDVASRWLFVPAA
ncbi:MAG: acyltransferase, partial [Gemmatimonadaceae bacterium]|nr:acyltransferase [Gemmatimonadaceae bacterium]